MLLTNNSLPFLTIIVSTIITESHCNRVSDSDGLGNVRYQRFVKNVEEIPSSEGKWSMIGNDPKCSLVLAKSVDQVMESYMPDGEVLCILVAEEAENNCFTNALERLLKLGTRSVITVKNHGRSVQLKEVVFQKPDVYILLGIDLSTEWIKRNLIDFGKMGSTWNPRGLYISVAQSKDEAASLMTNLWIKFVYKVIVLVFPNKNSDVVEAYTWRPYYPPNNCGPPMAENIVKLGEFGEELKKFEKETDTAPGMIPENFGNCPLKVSFNIWPPFVDDTTDEDENAGIEVRLIQMVCKKIGIDVIAHYHPLTLDRDTSDAWAGSVVPRNSFLTDYDIANPYIQTHRLVGVRGFEQDELVWNVPTKFEIRSVGLDNGISPTLWAPSFLAIVLIAVLLRVAGIQHWILWVWGSLWEQFDHGLPMKLRGVWGCWLLLCLHLSVAYRTTLVSNLAEPLIVKGPGSQSELVGAGLKLGFLSTAEAYFSQDDEVQQWILEHYDKCTTVDECYKEIPAGKAVFTDKLHADYLNLQQTETSNLDDQVRQLPPSLVYKVTMLYKKGHPVLEGFDEVCHLAQQAGLVQFLIRNVINAQTNIQMRRLNSRKEHSLSFPQVRKGFHLLAVGLTFAVLTFLCETLHEVFEIRYQSCIKDIRRIWSEKLRMRI